MSDLPPIQRGMTVGFYARRGVYAGDSSSLPGYQLISDTTPRRLSAMVSSSAAGWLLTPDEGSVVDSGNSITASDLRSATTYTLKPLTPGDG